MKDAQYPMWQHAWNFWSGCFHAFFGCFPAGLYLRRICPGVLSGTGDGGSVTYYLSIAESDDVSAVFETLTRESGQFFVSNGILFRVHDRLILFQAGPSEGSAASLRYRSDQERWELHAPSDLFMGDAGPDLEDGWDDVAAEIYRALAIHFP